MLINLLVERVRQWLVLPEPSQQRHPIVQVECLLLIAKILIESCNNIYEGVHDVREECNTEQLNHHDDDFLTIRYGVQISIANC